MWRHRQSWSPATAPPPSGLGPTQQHPQPRVAGMGDAGSMGSIQQLLWEALGWW